MPHLHLPTYFDYTDSTVSPKRVPIPPQTEKLIYSIFYPSLVSSENTALIRIDL